MKIASFRIFHDSDFQFELENYRFSISTRIILIYEFDNFVGMFFSSKLLNVCQFSSLKSFISIKILAIVDYFFLLIFFLFSCLIFILIDPAQYQNTYPCPMPTYPKNVHIGLLIGSDSDKGPCKKNTYQTPTHAHDMMDATSPKSTVCYKTENYEDIKPVELIVSHAFDSSNPKDILIEKSYESITLATSPPQTAKMLDHLELKTHGSIQTPVSSRRARVGKTMARSQLRTINDASKFDDMHKMPQSKLKRNQNENGKLEPFHVQANVIKTENVKMECDDDVLIISDTSDKSDSIVSDQCASESIQCIDLSPAQCTADEQCLINKRPATDQIDEIVDLDEDDVTTVKRRKMVEFCKQTGKKTSPNSYKSLIKPSNPKEYLCKAEEKKTKYMNAKTCRHPTDAISINGKTTHQSSKLSENQMTDEENGDVETIESTPSPSINGDSISIDDQEKIDEIVLEVESSSSQSSGDSEQSVSIRPPTLSRAKTADNKKTNGNNCETNKNDVAKAKLTKTAAKSHTIDTDASKMLNKKSAARNEPKTKPVNKTKTIDTNKMQLAPCRDHCAEQEADTDTTDIESVSSDVSFLVSNSHNNNNNNDSLLDKNNRTHLDGASVSPVPELRRKPKSRGSKFSNKKKHRVKQPKFEECILPSRALSAVPKWSNGWQWIGEPYQGKVFLNVSFSFLG